MKYSDENLHLLICEAQERNEVLIDFPREFQSSEEMQVFYSRYGYITLKRHIPSEYIEYVVNDLKTIFEPYASDKQNPVDSAIINLDKKDKKHLYELHMAALKLTSLKRLTFFLGETVKSISGGNAPVLEIVTSFLLNMPKDDRLVYDFHQESSYMKGFGDIFNVHYPLFRTSTIENGTMSILPGTHKLGNLEYEKSRKSNDSYTDLLPKNISEIIGSYPELHCYLEVGDVIFFHKYLTHKSNYNSSTLARLIGIQRLTQSITGGDWVRRRPEEL
ncbi:phytanoyl-CoA dioxygenase family protein [Nitrospinaceae bacterium]|nr:phytanoyl-CoA dioxygenase family protein [Nitrospinaceae bacterium]